MSIREEIVSSKRKKKNCNFVVSFFLITDTSIKSFYGHLPLKQDQLMRVKLIKGTSLYSDSHEQSNESPIVALRLCKIEQLEESGL